VLAATGLIGTNVIGADDLAVFLSDKGFSIIPYALADAAESHGFAGGRAWNAPKAGELIMKKEDLSHIFSKMTSPHALQFLVRRAFCIALLRKMHKEWRHR
jgi:hypothetical protein